MIGEEKGSVANGGRSSHKMTGLNSLPLPFQKPATQAKVNFEDRNKSPSTSVKKANASCFL